MSQDATGEALTRTTCLGDTEIAQRLTRRLASGVPGPVDVLFRDAGVAELWRSDERVTPYAWGPVLARQAIAATPPAPRESVAPPPVIVGDGPMAALLLEELVAGWAEPGQRTIVHCLGWVGNWAEAGASWAGDAAQISWSQVALRPASVLRRVEELVGCWSPPAPHHGVATGPTVYVACEDEPIGVTIADFIARRSEGARVVALVSGEIGWPAGVSRLHSVRDAARRALAGDAAEPLELARRSLEDIAWLGAPDSSVTAPIEPVFTHPVDGLAWEGQPADVREEFLAVANDVVGLLALGDIEATLGPREPGFVVQTPSELTAVASGLLRLLGRYRSPGTWQTALEFAARLPVLAARAGYTVRRPAGYDALLTDELLDRLAPQVHLTYQGISQATTNATGSPLAGALWQSLSEFDRASNRMVIAGSAVAHAAAGLTWRRPTAAGGIVPDERRLALLGELEHRRWAIHQRRNGRPRHAWARPWDALGQERQRYDIVIMGELHNILADANIELADAQ